MTVGWLDLFYAKVKFGEKWKLLFFENIAALGLKVAWSIQLNE